jgi:hypothetical protein
MVDATGDTPLRMSAHAGFCLVVAPARNVIPVTPSGTEAKSGGPKSGWQ